MAESWRNRTTLILDWSDMVGLLTPAEYVDCVEHAYRMHGLGRVYMEPKGHIVLDRYKGEWEVMPSYIEEPEAAACKWVSIREDNAQYELPAVFSILTTFRGLESISFGGYMSGGTRNMTAWYCRPSAAWTRRRG